MINQSLIIAVLLVPKGTRSLPDQYNRFPDSRRQSARSLPSESNQMVNDAPLQAMTWCPYKLSLEYVSHGSLRFIKSIQICKRFSRADWKYWKLFECQVVRQVVELLSVRQMDALSDPDLTLIPYLCLTWPGFYNRYFSTQLGESDMSGWRQVRAAFKCDGLKFWIYPKDMLRFEDSWDQSRQGLLELLEAWTSPLFLLDILTWLLIVLHPTFDIDYIIIYTYIYIYIYIFISRLITGIYQTCCR